MKVSGCLRRHRPHTAGEGGAGGAHDPQSRRFTLSRESPPLNARLDIPACGPEFSAGNRVALLRSISGGAPWHATTAKGRARTSTGADT